MTATLATLDMVAADEGALEFGEGGGLEELGGVRESARGGWGPLASARGHAWNGTRARGGRTGRPGPARSPRTGERTSIIVRASGFDARAGGNQCAQTRERRVGGSFGIGHRLARGSCPGRPNSDSTNARSTQARSVLTLYFLAQV